jgi:hypothetical protein
LHPQMKHFFKDWSEFSHTAPRPGLFQHGEDSGILGYLRQWDRHGRLLLLSPGEVKRSHWGELFEVPKSAQATRVVFNRTPRNDFELHLAHFSKEIPSGSALCDLHLPMGHEFQVSSEDLSDY